MHSNKIDIILVTGFLGSGKTTFLNRVIKFYNDKRVAFIINDFGKIAIDGILLKEFNNNNSELNIYEISNGSIFCSCLSHKLIYVLKYFSEKEIDYLVIETSGLSDPTLFYKILTDNLLERFYKIKNSICILDASTVLKYYENLVVIRKQIETSNIILINKSDLIKKITLVEIVNLVFKLNPSGKVFKTVSSEIDFSLLENIASVNNNIPSSCLNKTPNIISKIYLEQKSIPQKVIVKFLKENLDRFLRVKGFLKGNKFINYISDKNGKIVVKKMNNVESLKFGISILLEEENESFINNELLKISTR